MIPFFRKIRYRLAQDNQFLKYSRYAVGEILLVVVGILIALYINNWNEERKDSKFERKMLLEVKKTMEQDLIELKYYKERNAAKKKGIQELLKISASGEKVPDSTLLKFYNRMIMGFNIVSNRGAYETIKTIGLDKISDDSVRTSLAFIFDVQLPRVSKSFEKYGDNTAISIEMNRLHESIWTRKQIQLDDGTWKLVSIPKSDHMTESQEFIDRIKIEQDHAAYMDYWLRNYEFLLDDGIRLLSRYEEP
jgi:hypothetical protein